MAQPMTRPKGPTGNDDLGIAGDVLDKLDLKSLGALVGLGADIVLFLDDSGVVHKSCVSDPDLVKLGLAKLEGRRLADAVTIESAPKITAMLSHDQTHRPARGYQVNHACPGKPDLPVLYSAFWTEGFSYTLVVGRELRQQALDQQRLVQTQMGLEADYRELQEAETRYRTAFNISSVGQLMLDGERKAVLDANSAAIQLLAPANGGLTGKPFRDLFAKQDRDRLSEAIGEARHSGAPVLLEGLHSAKGDALSLSLRSYRENGVTNLIVSAWPAAHGEQAKRQHAAPRSEAAISDLGLFPEAAVQTGLDGLIQSANTLFLDLVHAPSLSQVIGRHLSTWFTRAVIDLHVLFTRLTEERTVRGFSSTLTDNLSLDRPVTLSAHQDQESGTIRILVQPQAAANERVALPPPRTAEQADGFASLVGKVPLKDLIRESLDVIEKICIEAALDQTNNNRASAADILGLSRQSLYIKLRRYGLEDYRPAN